MEMVLGWLLCPFDMPYAGVNIAGEQLLSLEGPACKVALDWHLGTWLTKSSPHQYGKVPIPGRLVCPLKGTKHLLPSEFLEFWQLQGKECLHD